VSPDARRRRALGLDLGERRIGVAISDSAQSVASPLCTVDRRAGSTSGHEEIRELVREWEPGVIVVGLPLGLDGRRGKAALSAEQEASTLASELAGEGVEVVTHDERFTTVEADRALAATGMKGKKRRGSIDRSAAAVMLQAWLETRSGD
jgi:putative Holliday junction resolvase